MEAREHVVEVHAESTASYYRMIIIGDRGTQRRGNLYNTEDQVLRQGRQVIGLLMR